jgi:hypothetical protein
MFPISSIGLENLQEGASCISRCVLVGLYRTSKISTGG